MSGKNPNSFCNSMPAVSPKRGNTNIINKAQINPTTRKTGKRGCACVASRGRRRSINRNAKKAATAAIAVMSNRRIIRLSHRFLCCRASYPKGCNSNVSIILGIFFLKLKNPFLANCQQCKSCCRLRILRLVSAFAAALVRKSRLSPTKG